MEREGQEKGPQRSQRGRQSSPRGTVTRARSQRRRAKRKKLQDWRRVWGERGHRTEEPSHLGRRARLCVRGNPEPPRISQGRKVRDRVVRDRRSIGDRADGLRRLDGILASETPAMGAPDLAGDVQGRQSLQGHKGGQEAERHFGKEPDC